MIRQEQIHRMVSISTAVAALALLTAGCGGGSSNSNNKGPTGTFVYTESNLTTPNGNTVQAYTRDPTTGKLTLLGSFATGGTGAYGPELMPDGVMDTDRAIVANANRTVLFAVNQGSDTIAVFHINSDGTLTPIQGSPFASGGHAPVSLGLTHNDTVLTVVNSSLDPARVTTDILPNYTNFTVASNGKLTPVVNSTISLSAGAATPGDEAPSTALPSPDGTLIAGANLNGDQIPVFEVGANGSLTQSPGSPFTPDPSIFTGAAAGKPQHPFGEAFYPSTTRRILYISYPFAKQVGVYTYDANGTLTFVKAVANPGGAGCWLNINNSATRLYISNAGSGDITVYDIGTDPMTPSVIQSFNLTAVAGTANLNGNPWHSRLDPTGNFFYVLTPRDLGNTPAGQGNTLHVLSVDQNTGMLTEVPNSTINLGVPTTTSPQGLVVL